MTTVRVTLTALAIAAAPLAAHADELSFACKVTSAIDISDSQPYAFTVRVDRARPAIIDVDGDQGEGWVIDGLSDTRLDAHFDLPERIGSLTIDRNAGTIGMLVAFRGPVREVGQWRGTCEPGRLTP